MEKRKPIVISAVCLMIALGLISAFTSVRLSELTRDFGEPLEVVVAAQDIPEYGLIRPEMLKTVRIYKKFVQPQTIVVDGENSESLESAVQQIAGKSAFVPIYANEQVTLTKLVHQDGKPVLDRQLEKNNRAVTIQIAPHTGVGKLIRPGNRVDILAAIKYEQGGKFQVEVKTVFQNVLVLATGKSIVNSVPSRINRAVLSSLEGEFETQRRKDLYTTQIDPSTTSRPDDNYTNITVQLPPADAEKLLVLQHEIGDPSLYFTLRNSADTNVAALLTTLLDNVLGPNSAYGRSKVRPPDIKPAAPKFYDSRGGQLVPVY